MSFLIPRLMLRVYVNCECNRKEKMAEMLIILEAKIGKLLIEKKKIQKKVFTSGKYFSAQQGSRLYSSTAQYSRSFWNTNEKRVFGHVISIDQ